ncbi:MAG: hypothetical protein R3293_17750 [Candidatus Promineifilaceae bacterium]|nr:hypothetical protein [Candidatus Promineifilaceae bacterium]
MFRSLPMIVVVCLLMVNLVLTSCGLALRGRDEIQLQMPRSDMRDVVRDAALWADGEPIFESLDTNYIFEADRFHIEGDYQGPDGQSRHGILELAFTARRGDLQLAVVEHNIEGLDDELERVNAALSLELAQKIEDTLDRQVVEFREVKPIADNILQITLILQPGPDSMTIPLPGR